MVFGKQPVSLFEDALVALEGEGLAAVVAPGGGDAGPVGDDCVFVLGSRPLLARLRHRNAEVVACGVLAEIDVDAADGGRNPRCLTRSVEPFGWRGLLFFSHTSLTRRLAVCLQP